MLLWKCLYNYVIYLCEYHTILCLCLKFLTILISASSIELKSKDLKAHMQRSTAWYITCTVHSGSGPTYIVVAFHLMAVLPEWLHSISCLSHLSGCILSHGCPTWVVAFHLMANLPEWLHSISWLSYLSGCIPPHGCPTWAVSYTHLTLPTNHRV